MPGANIGVGVRCCESAGLSRDADNRRFESNLTAQPINRANTVAQSVADKLFNIWLGGWPKFFRKAAVNALALA